MTQRIQVLRTYRKLMRTGRTWPALDEREYIVSESRRIFRHNKSLEDPAKIEKKLFEATSRLELAQFYGIAAPRYFYNQPGVVEKARNKTAINVRPAYLDSEYERIGRGQGDDERNRLSIVGGSVPERAARAAAAAAAVAERSARGAILSALQDPQHDSQAAASSGQMVPKPPQPPGLRKKHQQTAQIPKPPPLLSQSAQKPNAPNAQPVAIDATRLSKPDQSGATSDNIGSASASASASANASASASDTKTRGSTRQNAVPTRKRRKTGRTDRSRHRVPTHL